MEKTREETWKPIIGFRDYIASNLGNVISNKRGVPKALKDTGLNCSYHLVSDAGEQCYFSRKKLVFAFLHDMNPVHISGYIIGTLGNLRLVSKEEFYTYTQQLMTDAKKVDEEKMQQFYDESLNDINIIRRFYQTRDITEVAEAIHRNREVTIAYIIKTRMCNRNSAYDIWSDIQEKCLVGICNKKLAVLNIRTYLARMVRSEMAYRKKESSRMVHYEDGILWRGV